MTERRQTRGEHQKAQTRNNKKSTPKKPFKVWLKRIILTLLFLGIGGGAAGAGLFAFYASSAPKLDEELLKDPLSAKFYDKNKELFATIGAENRQYVEYKDIPEDMRNAILATEDVRFFEHGGLDFYRLGGAVLANVRDGFGSQGASTLTQQVVKNSFLQNEKKLKRKAQEAWLAFQLERKYSKEEIFEMYFNKVLMSGRVYGIGTAAQYFYGKELSELSLEEEAMLAGMVQLPNAFNPIQNPERAEKRRNIVLSLMLQHEKITKAEMEAAKAVDVQAGLADDATRQAFAGSKYDAFLDVVLNELETNGDGNALAEGIQIYTTLDPNAQKIVENALNDDSNFPTEKIESGISVIDTKTGQIHAVGGGRNYGNRGYNYADDLKQTHPGSTMKPLLDYGPAFEYLKWSTGETTVDEPMKYTSSQQTITNWDSKYQGPMTVRQALYTSRNVPAVKTFKEVGSDKAKEFVNRLGINANSIVEADAIGGGKITINPIQMAASYAAFGNNGVYTDPYSITKIVYRDGKTTKNYKPEPSVAMSESTAYMVTDILRDVVSTKPGASGTLAMVSGLDIAGKTGTTNYSKDDFKKHNLPSTSVPDSWFAGYTTNYSIAIWSGYEKRYDPITTTAERNLPQKLFKNIMGDLSKSVETSRFKKPGTVVEATIEVGTNPLKLASEFTPKELRRTELFVRGTEPKTVSDKFEEIVIPAPYDVSATLNEVSQAIDVTWKHDAPIDKETEEVKPVKFEVAMSMDGGENIIVGTTESNNVTVPNFKPGSKYVFTVTAIVDETRSEPATASLQIEKEEEDEEVEPEIPEIIDPTPPDQGNGNENGNNGNGNGNGNGGQVPTNPPTDPSQPTRPEDGEDDEGTP
ncbi:MAG: PBP1A family penicillin-binding protein [Lysinibacillus sp.]